MEGICPPGFFGGELFFASFAGPLSVFMDNPVPESEDMD
jgi:hypothetical protein